MTNDDLYTCKPWLSQCVVQQLECGSTVLSRFIRWFFKGGPDQC